MRALKTILIIVGAVVGILVILGLFKEPKFRLERSTVIHAPAAAVYANVSTLANMDKWGPWKEEEPDMVVNLSGSPDGQVGAVSHWKSSKSEGEQELAELVPSEKVRTKLRFMSPWEANNEGTFDLSAMGDSTKITWGLQGENGLMMRVMSVFMDMDAAVGPMFEKGLSNLKSLTEKEYAAAMAAAKIEPTYAIAVTEWPSKLYVGKREVVKWADMKEFFSKNLGANMAAAGKAGVQPAGAPSGVYFEWNEKDMTADMIAGIPVPAEAKAKLKGLDLYETPASKALTTDYYGGYGGLEKPHMAMDAYMKANNLTMNANVIEEYLTDPGHEPDSTKWLTRIIYLVK